ncbi:MAG: ribonuclease HII [Proteobacteria bacterium]|nr:ribonuclease HII [Pseudomonadota bacterium]
MSLKKSVIGVDEVGRGSLAGPVIASASIINENFMQIAIKDSKQFSERQIIKVAEALISSKIQYSIGIATTEEINNLNILQASLLAMRRAIFGIVGNDIKNSLILVDGNQKPISSSNVHSIIKGDITNRSIAASSIIAKYYRDKVMRNLSKKFPHYCWFSNKGYGTKSHQEAIKQYGLSALHRKIFCRKILENSEYIC